MLNHLTQQISTTTKSTILLTLLYAYKAASKERECSHNLIPAARSLDQELGTGTATTWYRRMNGSPHPPRITSRQHSYSSPCLRECVRECAVSTPRGQYFLRHHLCRLLTHIPPHLTPSLEARICELFIASRVTSNLS